MGLGVTRRAGSAIGLGVRRQAEREREVRVTRSSFG